MTGRPLTQYAVPITFGLKVAHWLSGVLDAEDAIGRARESIPVQCRGAAGTLTLVAELVPDPVGTAHVFVGELGLVSPGISWHTTRTPVTPVRDALVQAVDALGVLAADVAVLGRPEAAELREGTAKGRGSSSTMPQKRDPVAGSSQRWFAPGFLERGGDTAGRLLQTLSDADDESYPLACGALAEFDRRPDLDRVTVPFLLGPGEHDGVVPPARAQQDADAIAGSRLQIFTGCGHLPPAESPNAVAQALTELFAHDEETR